MDVSVVICTYNRAELLRVALGHLAEQERDGVTAEIIVVDNNSSDHTADVVKELAASSTVEIRYAFERSQGISHARNTGWRLARGAVVAFTDDDVRVDSRWIARIRQAFAAHGDIDCIGGKVLPIWVEPRPSWLTEKHWAPLALVDYGDAPLVLDPSDPRCLLGANLACRRDALARLHGFSPIVQRVKDGIGSIEDHEFLIRLWSDGGRALYLPELVVRAPVDGPRQRKAYHRRWHRGHGHFHALMRLSAIEASARGKLLGVPAHLYRQFLVDAAAWVAMAARRKSADAFQRETRMWFFYGFLSTRGREHLTRAASANPGNGDGDRSARTPRRHIARALHRMDDWWTRRRGLPRQVMFEAANPMLFNVFRPIYDRLSADPRVRLTLVPNGHEFAPGEIFFAASGKDRIVAPRRAAWMKPDVYISTDLWSMTWLYRRPRRVHLFHGVAGKYDLDAPRALADAVRTFDRILFPNRDRLERYVAAGLVDADGSVAELTGYPKADCLVDGSIDRREVLTRLRLDPSRPTVIYAPTWSAQSSLNAAGDRIIATLADAGLNVIVKLHVCSYTARGSGGVDWRDRLGRWSDHSAVRVVSDPDASPYLVAADLLVTDHSTVGFEFMVLDRPVVVVHQPALVAGAQISPDKVQRLHGASRVVNDVGDLAEAVRNELRRPERLSANRRAAAEAMFYRCGTATDRAMAVLYELLELPAGSESAAAAVSQRAGAAFQRPGDEVPVP